MTAPPAPAPFAIGLGANLGDDAARLGRFAAVAAWWARHGAVTTSRVYRSAALTPGQPDYLNAALAVAPRRPWPPHRVLAALHGLEARAGRDRAREGRWGARTLDLDLLVWGDRTVATARLVVPHPRLAERSFALAPLVDLFGPAAVAPGLPAPLGALLAEAGPPLAVTDYGFAPGAPPVA